jgi:hypothetical protein
MSFALYLGTTSTHPPTATDAGPVEPDGLDLARGTPLERRAMMLFI